MTDSASFHSRKLKIALVCDWYLPRMGGLELYLHDLALRLKREGHEVHLVTPIPGSKNIDGIPVHRLNVPLLPQFKLVFTRSAFKKLESIFRTEHYDIIHFHSGIVSPIVFGGVYLCKKMGIPTLVTGHSILGPFRWGLAVLNKVFNWSNWPVLFSGVSEVVVRDLKFLVKDKDVAILPNGLNVSEWAITPQKRDPHEVLIVSVMRLFRKKRGKALIRLMPGIIKRIPGNIKIKLSIIGEGPNRGIFERKIKRLGLENIVELLGHQTREKIRKIFSRADIYVQPTRWESFGLAALEARCAGLPVVAKNRGGIKGFIQHGQEGFLAGNDKELEDFLVHLILKPELRKVIARNNRETKPLFDWKGVMKQHEMAYQKAIRIGQGATG